MNPLIKQSIKLRQKEIEESVLRLVYDKDGRKWIDLGNYALDFSVSYLFLGFTKSGNVKLGEITQFAYNGQPEQIKNRIGKVDDGKLHTDGYRYSVRLNQ